ncbi:HAMP domain-containing sensor histidine kinase [Pseudoalteromonas sp. R3]|uniref:sensor histidine kinase n=1 Tax=Pseudoalteromonas sp. R3 TaxID=1709477 RepID=UPI0006B40FEF|nr:HAMP domain-containing sensor histidine kinase [Pseudoalteromonas sp. R3]AZZ97123.1 HAMP domain-containing histidine kinase [Pseudoalteromonas sp. R3]
MQLKQSLLLFKVAAIGAALIIATVSWFLYRELDHSKQLNDHLFKLQTQIQRLLDQEERFVIERQKASLLSIDDYRYAYRDSFNELVALLMTDHQHLELLFKLDEQVNQFAELYEQLASMQALLGYDKDDGVYGEFRSKAHALQALAKEAQDPQLEILLLELRRREKDFLLRLDRNYLNLHGDLILQAKNRIRTQFPDRAEAFLLTLEHYQNGFVVYTNVLQKQGLDHNQGVRGELGELKLAIRGHFTIVAKQLFSAYQEEQQQLILISLLSIVLSSGFSLLLLYYLNSRVSEQVMAIGRVLVRVAKHEDFSLRVNLKSEDEIAQIGHHLDELLDFIETLMARLSAAQQRLIEEAKMASLSNMVSGFAHELNTPLGIAITSQSHLKAQVENMRRDLDSGQLKKTTLTNLIGEAESALFLLENNLHRTASLIDDFKKVSAQQHYDTEMEFDLKTLVEGVFDCYRSELPEEEYKIEVEIPDNLILSSYPNVFNQIIGYSLNNSILHGKHPDRQLTIIVSAHIVNDYVHFYFKDDGQGIDKELLPVIFEPFVTSKRHSGGTGLGLSIIYNLVTQKLGGEIKIQSPAHGGACLHIILANTAFKMVSPEPCD